MNNWLTQIRLDAGFKSIRALAFEAKVDVSTLARIENGVHTPSPDTLKKLAPHVQRTYKELMILAGHLTEADLSPPFRFDRSLGDLHTDAIRQDSEFENSTVHHLSHYSERMFEIPLIGTIADGTPVCAKVNIRGMMPIPQQWLKDDAQYAVLHVTSNTMTRARIYDGDMVLIKVQDDCKDGEICAVQTAGDVKLWRVYKMNGQLDLVPDDPICRRQLVNRKDARIIGKVTKVIFDPT